MSVSKIRGEAICVPCGYYITAIPLTGKHWHNDIVDAEIYECDGIQTCPGCGIGFPIMVVENQNNLTFPSSLVESKRVER